MEGGGFQFTDTFLGASQASQGPPLSLEFRDPACLLPFLGFQWLRGMR